MLLLHQELSYLIDKIFQKSSRKFKHNTYAICYQKFHKQPAIKAQHLKLSTFFKTLPYFNFQSVRVETKIQTKLIDEDFISFIANDHLRQYQTMMKIFLNFFFCGIFG